MTWQEKFRRNVAEFLGVNESTVGGAVLGYEGRSWQPLAAFIPHLARHRLVVVRLDEALILAARPVSALPVRVLWSGPLSELVIGKRGTIRTAVVAGDHTVYLYSPAREELAGALARE